VANNLNLPGKRVTDAIDDLVQEIVSDQTKKNETGKKENKK
jgi:hypothetical protein